MAGDGPGEIAVGLVGRQRASGAVVTEEDIGVKWPPARDPVRLLHGEPYD